MPKLKIDGEKWKYQVGASNVVITSPDGEQFVASQEELTSEYEYITKDDVREYIERELL